MKCKITASGDKSRLTRTSSSARAIKSTIPTRASSSSYPTNFKIRYRHGLSPSRSSSIHGCRTQTRSSTSSTAPTSARGKHDSKNNDNTSDGGDGLFKESKRAKESTDHRCKCICANCGLSISDSGTSDHHDVSIRREPINLGTTNVRQILQCVHNGTPEIKDIVLNECNIIYECRICRNLFRSLANLLSHKRYYCKNHRCESMLLFDDQYLADESNDNILLDYGPISQPNSSRPSDDKIVKIGNERVSTIVLNNGNKIITSQSTDSAKSQPTQGSNESLNSQKNVQPGTLTAKRKHLELCVNKLLLEKSSVTSSSPSSSSKVDSVDLLTETSTKRNTSDQVQENNHSTGSLNIDDSIQNIDSSNHGEQSTSLPLKNPQEASSTMKEIQSTAATTVYNIDENANHSVEVEENESNEQRTVNYPQSICSLVSDDGECSRISEMLHLGSISGMESESMDVENIVSKQELSHQSLVSSNSSSPSSSTREYSSNRNKPKTFDDNTYETKLSPCSATVPCSMCNSKFISKKTLNVHIRTIHNIQRLIYPCPFCCVTFKQLFNATRHLIQVHRKGKTQVKYLREAIKNRAYPEIIKSEDGLDESERPEDCDDFDLSGNEDLDQEDELEDEDSLPEVKTEPSPESAPMIIPIKKIGKSSKRKGCDSYKEEEYKKCSTSMGEMKSTDSNPQRNNGNQPHCDNGLGEANSQSISSEKEEKKMPNQEKVRRVNPIIFSCINNCGEYFIKADSKNLHEKKCSKPDSCDQEKVHFDVKESSSVEHKQREDLDLNIITDSVYKELEKVGNLITRRCNHCPGLQFKSKTLLIQHLIVHIGYEVLKCKKCAYQTLNRTEMDNHLNGTHGIPTILKGSRVANLSHPLENDAIDGSAVKKISSRCELKEDSQESNRGNADESKTSSEKSNSSGIVLHLRPKLSRNRKKKKIYEIVDD